MGEAIFPISKEDPTEQTPRNRMSVSFKVTLSKGEEQETRRFLVSEEVVSSLVYLKQKIATLFPAFRRTEPVLSWVDEDGDEVAVASDEELEVALAALPGPVYKFRVKLADRRKSGSGQGRGLHVQHKMIRLPAPCKRGSGSSPRCHLARANMQRGPFPGFSPNSMLGNPNVHMLAGLLGGKPWVSG